MLAHTPAWAPVAVLGLAFLYYRRIRGHFGRQRYRPAAAWTRTAVLAAAALMLAGAAAFVPHAAWPMAGGAACGLALSVYALRHTRIEAGNPAHYTPNPWIGAALVVLIVARLAWRAATGGFGGSVAPHATSPAMLGLVSALVGYSLAYGVGVSRGVRRANAAPAHG